APAFPYQHLTSAHYVMDLIYNPAQTRFLQLASKQGAHTENGMPMLIGQAEGAWAIWSGTSS
ncbi:MAG: shikimate dehydrogenase, partial [Bacteroidetes bacterium]